MSLYICALYSLAQIMKYSYQQRKIKTMKAKTDQLTITIKVAFLSIAIFFSIEIFAQSSIGNYDIKNLSANLIQSSDDIISAYKNSIASDFFYEDQINLEEWMINLEEFTTGSSSSSIEISDHSLSETDLNLIFTDEELILEDWMTCSDWSSNNYDYFYEEALQMEEWMCCPREWRIKTSYTASL